MPRPRRLAALTKSSFQAGQQLQRAALTLAGGVLDVSFAGFTDTPTNRSHTTVGCSAFDPSRPFNSCRIRYFAPHPTAPSRNTAASPAAAPSGWAAADRRWMARTICISPPAMEISTLSPARMARNTPIPTLKFSTSGGLSVADYFTIHNRSLPKGERSRPGLRRCDAVAGSAQSLPAPPDYRWQRPPTSDLIIDRDQFTTDNQHFSTNGVDQVVQIMPLGGGSFDTPAYFAMAGSITVRSRTSLRYYVISNGTMIPDLPHSAGTRKFAVPGTTPSISANGNQDGILWAIQNAQPAVLVAAYDATGSFPQETLQQFTSRPTRSTDCRREIRGAHRCQR